MNPFQNIRKSTLKLILILATVCISVAFVRVQDNTQTLQRQANQIAAQEAQERLDYEQKKLDKATRRANKIAQDLRHEIQEALLDSMLALTEEQRAEVRSMAAVDEQRTKVVEYLNRTAKFQTSVTSGAVMPLNREARVLQNIGRIHGAKVVETTRIEKRADKVRQAQEVYHQVLEQITDLMPDPEQPTSVEGPFERNVTGQDHFVTGDIAMQDAH